MYLIEKSYTFDAAHCLPHLPDGHKCHNPHGHTYKVTVRLAGEQLNRDDFVMDFNELKSLKQFIDLELDHRDLNQVFEFPTTSENLAHALYDWCRHWLPLPGNAWVDSVSISETPTSCATYYEPVNDQPNRVRGHL